MKLIHQRFEALRRSFNPRKDGYAEFRSRLIGLLTAEDLGDPDDEPRSLLKSLYAPFGADDLRPYKSAGEEVVLQKEPCIVIALTSIYDGPSLSIVSQREVERIFPNGISRVHGVQFEGDGDAEPDQFGTIMRILALLGFFRTPEGLHEAFLLDEVRPPIPISEVKGLWGKWDSFGLGKPEDLDCKVVDVVSMLYHGSF